MQLKLEEAITSQSDVTYSIVRPTAFFKSLAGQVGKSTRTGGFGIEGLRFTPWPCASPSLGRQTNRIESNVCSRGADPCANGSIFEPLAPQNAFSMPSSEQIARNL